MAVVEVIGKSIANRATLLEQIKADFVAAGWTMVEGDLFTECSCSYTAVNTTDDTFTIVGHDLANGDIVYFHSSGTAPSPMSNMYPYFVVQVSGDTFKLSSTYGGSPYNLTTQGTGTHYFQKHRVIFSSQGESGTKVKGYISIYRGSGALTSMNFLACYGYSAGTRAEVGKTSVNTWTTSESGMYYYFWGDKDFVLIAVKAGTYWYTGGFGWPIDYYSDQTTLTAQATSGTPKQLQVASSSIFKAGKQYQILGLQGEGRDFLTVNSVNDGTHITVANLPRVYESGSIIGQVTNSFGMLYCQGNSMNWRGINAIEAVGTGDPVSFYACSQVLTSTAVDPDSRGDQKYILQPIIVGNSSEINGWLAATTALHIPSTGVAAEDTAGVTEADSGTASSGTATTLVDNTKAWTVDAFIGKCIIIKAGQGAGQIRKITDNDATSVTVAAWTTQPNNTSTYAIVDEAYRCFPSSPMAYAVREGRV